ncbi:hypothetical protein [Desulfohalovibrio reitneri]|uniref:hypothetical protein n=1 Tax=Desulfohalovibrio reitneri TaxID=1307759 RepID=UPI0004A7473B|nr:hypothetical protein [Desulfohalovibrio reitneri]
MAGERSDTGAEAGTGASPEPRRIREAGDTARERLAEVLGGKAAEALLEHARRATAAGRPAFGRIRVVEGGLDLSAAAGDPELAGELEDGLDDFRRNLVELLVELTGGMLLPRLGPLLEGTGSSLRPGEGR